LSTAASFNLFNLATLLSFRLAQSLDLGPDELLSFRAFL
jgi:hypothetical protein